jgi:cell wall-associated NlpC family hydrolase
MPPKKGASREAKQAETSADKKRRALRQRRIIGISVKYLSQLSTRCAMLADYVNTVTGAQRGSSETLHVTIRSTKFPRFTDRHCTAVRIAALSVVLLLLAACSAPRQQDAGQPASSIPATFEPRARAAEVAVLLIGAPYRYGGSGPESFDCSGLVQYSYRAAGITVPRTSGEQFGMAMPILLTDAQPGDLLFFRYDGALSHVGIYLGDLRFVHAPSSGKQVEVSSLQDPHYQQRFVQAGRVR